MIRVPDSVAFYWGDDINCAAINVLAGSSEVPSDLTLAEAERFELATLASRRVRVEYWGMLRAIWSATWGRAVEEYLPSARILTYGAHRAFYKETEKFADPSVDAAWEQRAVPGAFDVGKHGRLFTRISLAENGRDGELLFYLIDADGGCAVTDELDLGSGWSDDGESRRVTAAGLLPVDKVGSQIDPDPILAVVLGAATALAVALS